MKPLRMVLAGLAAVIALSGAVQAQTLRIAGNFAPSHSSSKAMELFKSELKRVSGGPLDADLFPGMQLGGAKENVDAVRAGTIFGTWVGTAFVSRLVPEIEAVSLPFLFQSRESAFRVMDGSVGDLLEQKLGAKGFTALGWMELGSRQTTNNKRPIHRPEDLKGLKIRTPLDPATVDMFAAMGATPQQINWGEVYIALQQGVVDGQENPLANIHAAKLYEVQKYISMTNHKYEVTGLVMSAIAWKRLGEAERAVLREAAKEASAYQRKVMLESDERFMAEFRKMPSLQINTVDTAPFRKSTEVVWDEWEKKPFGDFVKRLRKSRA